jgi:hypothetical protein
LILPLKGEEKKRKLSPQEGEKIEAAPPSREGEIRKPAACREEPHFF